MAGGSAAARVVAAGAAAHIVCRALGVPLKAAPRRALFAAACLHLARLLLRRRAGAAALFAAFFARFRVRGGTPLPLAAHAALALLYRRVGLRLPPQVPLAVFAAQVRRFGLWRRHRFERAMRQRYGPIYMMVTPTRGSVLTVFVSSPEIAEQVLGDKDTFPSRGHTGFSQITSEGLLGLETGPQWARHRKALSRFFSDEWLDRFSTTTGEEVGVILSKWARAAADQTRVNAHYDLSVLTLDMIMRCGLGAELSERQQLVPEAENDMYHNLDFILKEVVLRTAMPLLRFLPGPRQARLQASIKKGEELRDRLFAGAVARAADPSAPTTMLSAMMGMKDEDGAPELSQKEISDELHTIRGAGHETTSNTLCWTLLLLARHPAQFRKLRMEVDAAVAGGVPTFAELKGLRYAQQVVYEALRLFPTVPSYPRLAARDAVLGGYDVPKGSMVFVSLGALNYDEATWEDPQEFRPERFDILPELQPSRPVGVPGGHRFGFIPFGAGARTCVGQRLAMMEALQILGAIVKRFDIALSEPDVPVAEWADITLGPKSGLWFDLRERGDAPVARQQGGPEQQEPRAP